MNTESGALTTHGVDDLNPQTRRDPALTVGTPVDVRRRFDQRWARGFHVAEVLDQGYVLRRLSDDSILPAVFAPHDLRPVVAPGEAVA